MNPKPKISPLYPFKLEAGKTLTVPDGEKIRITGGNMRHVTGTDTVLYVLTPLHTSAINLDSIAGATGSGIYFLNDKVATNHVHMIDTSNFWIPERMKIGLAGASGAWAILMLEKRPIE